MLSKIVSRNVRNLRAAANLSQVQLAKASGLSIRYISRLESKPQNATLEIIEKLAKGLGCTPSEIIGEFTHRSLTKRDSDLLAGAAKTIMRVRSRIKIPLG